MESERERIPPPPRQRGLSFLSPSRDPKASFLGPSLPSAAHPPRPMATRSTDSQRCGRLAPAGVMDAGLLRSLSQKCQTSPC